MFKLNVQNNSAQKSRGEPLHSCSHSSLSVVDRYAHVIISCYQRLCG